MRIGLIYISQETNDFNPVPTALDDFRAFGIYEGEEILRKQRGVGQVGGYIETVERSGLNIETVPIISTWSDRHRSAMGRRISGSCTVAEEARNVFWASGAP